MFNLKSDNSRIWIIISLFAVFLVTYVSFYPSLCNGFVNWDDGMYLTGNRLVHQLSWQSLNKIFMSIHVVNYHPLALLSYAVEYRFFGMDNAFFYHATNLALHLINALLVFWLIYLLSGSTPVSFIAAVLFGIHPMHVESVAWISERRDVLYTVFFLGSMISYLYYLKKWDRKYYDISLVLFIASCMSKAMGVTLPAILLLLDYLKFRKIDKKTLLEKVPFFIVAFAFLIVTVLAWVIIQRVGVSRSQGFANNFPFAVYDVIFYVKKAFIPAKLSCFYPYPDEPVYSAKQLLFIAVTFLSLSGLIVFSGKFTRKVIFGTLFFIISVFLVLNFFGSQQPIAADRYTYVPYIGLFYIAAEGFGWLYTKKAAYRVPLVIISACIITALSVQTWQRCHVWRDSTALWSDALRKYPNELACNNLGVAYRDTGDYDGAMLQFNQAISINQVRAGPYNNRGTVYSIKGDYDMAIKDFKKALELDPGLPIAHQNLGLCYKQKKEYEKAITEFTKSIMLDPEAVLPYYGRAECYRLLGKPLKSKADILKAKEIGP